MGLRLDPNNPEHRKFLQGKIDKNTGLPVMQMILKSKRTIIPDAPEVEKVAGKSKYGNKKVLREGIWWDSTWEYECWLILRPLEKRGIIIGLERQIKYSFELNGTYITKYVADFQFYVPQKDAEPKFIVADAKSEVTSKMQRFGIQKKLMRAFYQLEIVNYYKGITNVEKEIYEIYNS